MGHLLEEQMMTPGVGILGTGSFCETTWLPNITLRKPTGGAPERENDIPVGKWRQGSLAEGKDGMKQDIQGQECRATFPLFWAQMIFQ